MPNTKPFSNAEVEAKFATYPPKIRRKLIAIRELIFKTAASTEGVGELEECLKWNQPAYVTAETRSGSTVRIDWMPSSPRQYAMFFHCQTTLIETFRAKYPNDFAFEANRAILFDEDDRVPMPILTECVREALTYHLRKKAGTGR